MINIVLRKIQCNYIKELINIDIDILKQKISNREAILSEIFFAEEREDF